MNKALVWELKGYLDNSYMKDGAEQPGWQKSNVPNVI